MEKHLTRVVDNTACMVPAYAAARAVLSVDERLPPRHAGSLLAYHLIDFSRYFFDQGDSYNSSLPPRKKAPTYLCRVSPQMIESISHERHKENHSPQPSLVRPSRP